MNRKAFMCYRQNDSQNTHKFVETQLSAYTQTP